MYNNSKDIVYKNGTKDEDHELSKSLKKQSFNLGFS